jgi:predicted phage-related endonuclease
MSQADTLNNLHGMMDEYASIKEQIAELEARKKELDADLRPALEGRGEVYYNGYTFKCVMVPGRQTLDKKAVEEAGIDLTPFQKQGAPFTQMTVKKVEEA